jgi:hypothetical protein
MRALKRLSKPVAKAKKHPLTARLSQSGHQLVWGLFLFGYTLPYSVNGKCEKYVLLFGDARFYDANEEPCKAQRATLVGNFLRGGRINSLEGKRKDISSQREIRCCARCVG